MTKNERQHYDKLAQLGCIACLVTGAGYSPTEIHHIKSGNAGMGKKSHWSLAIPLCHAHHRTGNHGTAIHAGKKAFEAAIGMTEVELLNETLNRLERESENI
jgi:hypothetical protein